MATTREATRESQVRRHEREEGEHLASSTRLRRSPSRARPVTRDDALFRLIGIGRSGIPGGISAKKHAYLAGAYRRR